jgi:iron(III) transport system substrate-binding protein
MSALRMFPHRVRRLLLGGLIATFCLGTTAQDVVRFPAKGRIPSGYPAGYAAVIAAAEQEGALVVYSTTDLAIAAPLIEGFQALYPRIEVRYQDMNSSDLYERYLDDALTSPSTADVVWSSAMDLQFRLVASGHSQSYDSPEAAALPAWARWKNLAFGTTYEPVAIVYNKQLLAAGDVPETHADLARLLTDQRSRFAGKVVTYNIERSGLGFLLATQDAAASNEFWQLATALGGVGAKGVPTTEAMLTRVRRGEDLIGYNALGSYAQIAAAKDPNLGYVLPRDYTLVVTRVLMIGKKAANPNAARLWIDYVLSKQGQTILATRSGLLPVRTDLDGGSPGAASIKALVPNARPIALDAEVASTVADPAKRLGFLKAWHSAFAAH